jgi:uncharacterized membrane protein
MALCKTAALVLVGAAATAIHLVSALSRSEVAQGIASQGLWRRIVETLGAKLGREGNEQIANVPMGPVLALCAGVSLLTWVGGALAISSRRRIPYPAALVLWGRAGCPWWIAPFAWEILGLMLELFDMLSLVALSRAALPFFYATIKAGYVTTFVVLAWGRDMVPQANAELRRVPWTVWIAAAAYFIVFTAMNWLLWESLLLPHGDSAMYEEHVWNLLHGKGFRSYLDGGRLFLGEHIQVIHLGVIPLYLLWPSHLLLELCQSAWLAAGAIPTYWIARRHSGSAMAASCLAIAYLLYFPMQCLDIAVTFKTFRPNSFEIPFILFGLDALERGRIKTLLVWLFLALLCQEDAATVIAPLGVWIAFRQSRVTAVADPSSRRRYLWLGAALAVFGSAYVAFVVKVALPWFRGGGDVHFARYFDEFGGESNTIVSSLLQHPGAFLAKLLDSPSWVFALGMLAPLGFLPLLSPGRLAVAAPLFGVLCLSSMTNTPVHHFHAPLVPVLIWATAAGLPQVRAVQRRIFRWWNHDPDRDAAGARKRLGPEIFISNGKSLPVAASVPARHEDSPGVVAPRSSNAIRVAVTAAAWCACCSMFSGAFLSLSPLGIGFWDPFSSRYWKDHYVPGERAKRFPAAFALVPRDRRVASTDYVHPRFTHHDRSYDYSNYRPDVPDDAEFIVIDTRHPYSDIKTPDQVKEYRDHPEIWELLPDGTEGYFIVLKRRQSPVEPAKPRDP